MRHSLDAPIAISIDNQVIATALSFVRSGGHWSLRLSQAQLATGQLTQLEVQVVSSFTHALPVINVREWLQRGVRSPKKAVLKERLLEMVNRDIR